MKEQIVHIHKKQNIYFYFCLIVFYYLYFLLLRAAVFKNAMLWYFTWFVVAAVAIGAHRASIGAFLAMSGGREVRRRWWVQKLGVGISTEFVWG